MVEIVKRVEPKVQSVEFVCRKCTSTLRATKNELNNVQIGMRSESPFGYIKCPVCGHLNSISCDSFK